MSINIVIATCNKFPEILPSDQYFADALLACGANVVAAPWNGPIEPFVRADTVVVRSTWDYFDKCDQFYAWFDQLERHQVRVENSLEILRWNARKHYLYDLAERGAPLIPIKAVPADAHDIQMVAQQQGWHRTVLKCVISGSALGLSLFDSNDLESIAKSLEVAKPWSEGGLMIQPYLPEIETQGEVSMVFIDGNFAHAVCKIPRANEFRVQSEYGGVYQRLDASDVLIEQGHDCLSFAPGMPHQAPLYARVDGLIIEGQFQLMELELTEPELMFPKAPASADVMAQAVLQRLA